MIKKILSFFVKILLILIIDVSFINASDLNEEYDWKEKTISDFAKSECITVPQSTDGFVFDAKKLDLSRSDWVKTSIVAKNNRAVQFKRYILGAQDPKTRKYLVLYRIDPRFPKPQIFIKKYNKEQKKYISDFTTYRNERLDDGLARYQERPEMDLKNRIKDYTDYFNFFDRERIRVEKDDIINITILDQNFFSPDEKMEQINSELTMLYGNSSDIKNKIIYSDIKNWCDYIDSGKSICTYDTKGDPLGYKNQYDIWNGFVGMAHIDSHFDKKRLSGIQSCAENSSSKTNNPLCYYDKGRGIRINVANSLVKSENQSFLEFKDRSIFYHKSKAGGYLDFDTNWDIEGMFDVSNWKTQVANKKKQFMYSWNFEDYNALKSQILNESDIYSTMKFMHFGQYVMLIEIGNGDSRISDDKDLDGVKVEYGVGEASWLGDWWGENAPTKASGSFSSRSYSNNIYVSDNQDKANAHIWVRVVNGNKDLVGYLQLHIAHYTSDILISKFIYDNLIEPLRKKITEITKIIYNGIISNTNFKLIVNGAMSLTISLYALFFLIGGSRIKVSDILSIAIKFALISIMMQKNISWQFFNGHFLNLFISGADYLISSVSGVTSSVSNVFGFIDPIFARYFNTKIWGLLFVQLFHISNGLFIFAIMTIYALIIYIRAIAEVIVSYCLAFIGLCIMISLSPFFLILILFNYTKPMFDRWVSSLFGYVLQPTILLIFFLLIDQIISVQLNRSVTKACPTSEFIPIRMGLDLTYYDIPVNFAIRIPPLPGIPGYESQPEPINDLSDIQGQGGTFVSIASASLLLLILCTMARGLVSFAHSISQKLAAAHSSPQVESGVVSDVWKAVSVPAAKVANNTVVPLGRAMKRFYIDQKYGHKRKNEEQEDKSKLSEPQKEKLVNAETKMNAAQNAFDSATKNLKKAKEFYEKNPQNDEAKQNLQRANKSFNEAKELLNREKGNLKTLENEISDSFYNDENDEKKLKRNEKDANNVDKEKIEEQQVENNASNDSKNDKKLEINQSRRRRNTFSHKDNRNSKIDNTDTKGENG